VIKLTLFRETLFLRRGITQSISKDISRNLANNTKEFRDIHPEDTLW